MRPARELIHGLNGPSAEVSARVAFYLLQKANLGEFRRTSRGKDVEVDATLDALKQIADIWHEAATGTKRAERPEPKQQWISTTEAATILHVGERAVRKAIESGRLNAVKADDRWRINRAELAHYRAARAA